jgi:single-stranded DNA-binding protein
LRVVMEDMQFLEPRADGGGGMRSAANRPPAPARSSSYDDGEGDSPVESASAGENQDIPF